ncbi:hypothetical protein CTAYLR_006820 [Chrysophaeum taylorii]|uniref:Diphthine--ammonia ligase n=1 Tax=Chrysophaeum taylorii TaxID=2483200 RepID=A0AAD7XKR6_9STRA|nr:hypothetical protein CTAYLR_006820 [Chrysophaeum taylorii]
MRFVALVSGGKDSVFSIIESERCGHELVACANLFPEGGEEIDSWMYQSAAHVVVPGIAECLGVPLFRRAIRGEAKSRELQYASVDGDEVEDLYALLADVKQAVPAVEAASCGAILSTYQRTRVEDVCRRLGLRSLAYLWQRDQREVLREMCRVLRPVIVKTASMGLEPGEHLGRTVDAALRRDFERFNASFGFHECGEGGEYETIVVDSARFSKRLVLDRTERLGPADVPRGCGAVGVLKVLAWHTEPKEGTFFVHDVEDASPYCDDDDDEEEARPPETGVSAAPKTRRVVALASLPSTTTSSTVSSCAATSGLVSVSLVLRRCGGETARLVGDALESARAALAARGASFSDCYYAHLYVSNMRDFEAANGAYAAAFGAASSSQVPSRACVGLAGAAVAVDVDAVVGRSRSVLDVKSVSRWAPVCIGPYCQANVVSGALVFVAGQIALDPPTMRLDEATDDLDLCLRHVNAVLKASPCDSSLDHVLSYVVYVVDAAELERSERLPRPVVAVAVPELPAKARVEVQVVAATAAAAPLFQRRDVTYESSTGFVDASVSAAPRAACVAALGVDADAAALLAACVHILRDSGLRYEHWTRLRVFVRWRDRDAWDAKIRSGLASLVPERSRLAGPAVSVVPVDAVGATQCCAHLVACDPDKLDADLWLRRPV